MDKSVLFCGILIVLLGLTSSTSTAMESEEKLRPVKPQPETPYRTIVNKAALLKEEAIIKLFRAERLSSGYAAKLLGLTRRDFFERLEQQGVALTAYTEADLTADLETLHRLESRSKDEGESPECGD